MLIYQLYYSDFFFLLNEIVIIFFLLFSLCFYTLYENLLMEDTFNFSYTVVVFLLFLVFLYGWLLIYEINSLFILFNFIFINKYIFSGFKFLLVIFIIFHLYSFISYKSFFLIKTIKFEYIYILSFLLIASIFFILSNDFLGMFLTLEFQNFCFYILVSLKKKQKLIAETSIKYYIYGSISSGFVLYGISLIYHSTGQINFVNLSMMLLYNNIDYFTLFLVYLCYCVDFFLN